MGLFSFYTADTNKPISCKMPKLITMVYKNEKGQILSVTESFYNGYGDFGGLDIYEILGKMNGVTDTTPLTDETFEKYGIPYTDTVFVWRNDIVRDIGIFATKGFNEWPQLFANTPPEIIDFTKPLKHDPNQGC